MSNISGFAEAAGIAAVLKVKSWVNYVRRVPASRIRYVLRKKGQLIEGKIEQPPFITGDH